MSGKRGLTNAGTGIMAENIALGRVQTSIEMTRDARFGVRVIRLAATSLVALGLIWGFQLATLQTPACRHLPGHRLGVDAGFADRQLALADGALRSRASLDPGRPRPHHNLPDGPAAGLGRSQGRLVDDHRGCAHGRCPGPLVLVPFGAGAAFPGRSLWAGSVDPGCGPHSPDRRGPGADRF